MLILSPMYASYDSSPQSHSKLARRQTVLFFSCTAVVEVSLRSSKMASTTIDFSLVTFLSVGQRPALLFAKQLMHQASCRNIVCSALDNHYERQPTMLGQEKEPLSESEHWDNGSQAAARRSRLGLEIGPRNQIQYERGAERTSNRQKTTALERQDCLE